MGAVSLVRRVLELTPMHRAGFVATEALAIAAVLFACGSKRLPAPSYTSQPTNALVEVPYPPPPARVEYVPPRPAGDAVWIDGEWTWRGRRWAWRAGRWVVPPANASFAPWTAVRDELGNLHVAQGAWRDAKGNEVNAPKALAFGRPSAGPVVNPEGEEEPAAPNQFRERRQSKDDAAIEDAPFDAGMTDTGVADVVELLDADDSGRMPQP
jgi:hypothetical protein